MTLVNDMQGIYNLQLLHSTDKNNYNTYGRLLFEIEIQLCKIIVIINN